jgi:heme exporter protein D
MRKRSIWITVAVTVLVVALLAVAGFSLFRLGYNQGLAQSTGGLMLRGFEGRLGGERMQPFAERMAPEFNHPGITMYDMHARSFGHFTAFGWLPGLLLLVGIAALVVIAVNSFSRRNQSVGEDPASSAEIEKPAPRRRTKKDE